MASAPILLSSDPSLISGRTDGGYGTTIDIDPTTNSAVTVNIISNPHSAVFDLNFTQLFSPDRILIVPVGAVVPTIVASGWYPGVQLQLQADVNTSPTFTIDVLIWNNFLMLPDRLINQSTTLINPAGANMGDVTAMTFSATDFTFDPSMANLTMEYTDPATYTRPLHDPTPVISELTFSITTTGNDYTNLNFRFSSFGLWPITEDVADFTTPSGTVAITIPVNDLEYCVSTTATITVVASDMTGTLVGPPETINANGNLNIVYTGVTAGVYTVEYRVEGNSSPAADVLMSQTVTVTVEDPEPEPEAEAEAEPEPEAPYDLFKNFSIEVQSTSKKGNVFYRLVTENDAADTVFQNEILRAFELIIQNYLEKNYFLPTLSPFQYFFYNPNTETVADKQDLLDYLTQDLTNPSLDYTFVTYLVNSSFSFLVKTCIDFYKEEASPQNEFEDINTMKYINGFENSVFRFSIKF